MAADFGQLCAAFAANRLAHFHRAFIDAIFRIAPGTNLNRHFSSQLGLTLLVALISFAADYIEPRRYPFMTTLSTVPALLAVRQLLWANAFAATNRTRRGRGEPHDSEVVEEVEKCIQHFLMRSHTRARGNAGQMFSKVLKHSAPRIFRRFFVVDLRTRVVEESVIGIVTDSLYW